MQKNTEYLKQKKKRQLNKKKSLTYADELCAKYTPAETILINELKKYKIPFQSQRPMFDFDGCYICDFYLKYAGKKFKHLVIEIDGLSHLGKEEYDERRTKWLNIVKNCEVIRFSNYDIFHNLPEVMESIMKYDLFKSNRIKKLQEKRKLERTLNPKASNRKPRKPRKPREPRKPKLRII